MSEQGLTTRQAKQTLRQMSGVIAIAAVVVLIATNTLAGTPRAQEKASVPKPQDKVTLGQNEVKRLLLLMDTDKNGKISKKEYMAFMEAEFNRLDKDKSGDLDVKELTQSRLTATYPSLVGK